MIRAIPDEIVYILHMDYARARPHHLVVPCSPQDLCFNSNPDGCNGGAPEVAWDYIKKTGIVSGTHRRRREFCHFAGTPSPHPY